MTNLLGLDRAGLQEFFVSIGEKPYRATQIMKWIHERGVTDFNLMLDISKDLRTRLIKECTIEAPTIKSEHVAHDETRKWLMSIPGGNLIETVFIPEEKRGTLCISSQIGCGLNCTFCSTARQGFNRNLSVAEIIGQVWMASQRLREVEDTRLSTKITNVVLMGMGEPLLNLDNVIPALSLMRDEHAYQLPRRRVTVSTSGVLPGIERLIKECDVALALSLHAPTDELRSTIVPINKKYNIKALMEVCEKYSAQNSRYFVTMEYVMLKGVNDSLLNAKQLANLLKNVKCKVNLIPFNPFPNSGYQGSSMDHIKEFAKILSDKKIVCTTRTTRGEDIDAACGQLVGKVLDKTKRAERFARSASTSASIST